MRNYSEAALRRFSDDKLLNLLWKSGRCYGINETFANGILRSCEEGRDRAKVIRGRVCAELRRRLALVPAA